MSKSSVGRTKKSSSKTTSKARKSKQTQANRDWFGSNSLSNDINPKRGGFRS